VTCEEEDQNVVFIAKYPNNKKAAISFTFDDGCESCLSTIAPLFRAYGYPATFFVIPGRIEKDEWKHWRKFSEDGFEIANHSLAHFTLTELEPAILDEHVNYAHELIRQNIGKAPISFAEPGHHTNEKVHETIFQKHLFARTKPGFCGWHGWTSKTTTKDAISHINEAIDKGAWYVPAAHGVDDCWEPISLQFLKGVLDHIELYEQYLAVETFGNLALYKTEYENTTVRLEDQKTSLTIELVSQLDPVRFNYPLTVVIRNCSFSNAFSVTPLNSNIVQFIKMGKTLYLKAAPGSKFEIKW
jgi:peptidoglycan/xylan/chitin deacetylase (PgdA/CDA1 family)